MSSQRQPVIEVSVAPLDDVETPLDDPPEEPEEIPEIDMTKNIDVEISISHDISVPSLSDAASPGAPAPTVDQAGVKLTPSPVVMPAVKGFKAKALGASGFGTKIGDGAGGGGLPEGALIGEIIDYKRNAKGEKTALDPTGDDYWALTRRLVEGKFAESVYKDVYRLPMRVALSCLWIPPQSADNGPRAFGAEKHMEPKAWAAHYSGTLTPTKNMRCRFIGYFDDMMMVTIDHKVVLEVRWSMKPTDKGPVTGWKSPDPGFRYTGPQSGCAMIAGDWIDFKKNKSVRIDLICGEKPGGLIGGLLLIEEEGAKYEKRADGSPKYPIFTTIPLSLRQVLEFKREKAFEIGTNPPRFNYRERRKGGKSPAREQEGKDDVLVDVSI